MSHIRLERPDDAVAVEHLIDQAFGPGRKTKTVYKLRAEAKPVGELCFVAIDDDGGIVASIRYWPVVAGDRPALLLGPLAVDPSKQGQGFGKALMRHSLATAARLGHGAVILVGDPEYYVPFGFRRELAEKLVLPGWVEERRFLGLELVAGRLSGAKGPVSALRGATRQSSPLEAGSEPRARAKAVSA